MRAVDTNVLVRLIVRDDTGQAERADKFVASGAWVSHLVLAETLWVLDAVYGVTSAGVARAVEMLLTHTTLSLEDADVVKAALDLFRQRPRVGFSDCLIIETARKAGHIPIGTFDTQMSRISGAQIV